MKFLSDQDLELTNPRILREAGSVETPASTYLLHVSKSIGCGSRCYKKMASAEISLYQHWKIFSFCLWKAVSVTLAISPSPYYT
jgi:hypothetical protein